VPGKNEDYRADVLRWAERYSELGLSCLPLCPVNHGIQQSGELGKCRKPGKVPFECETKKHASGWTTPINATSEDWRKWLEVDSINIGCLTGTPSSIIGVDLDGSENIKYFEELVSCRVDEIPTWVFSTGNGYRILYGIQESSRDNFPSFNIKEKGRQIEILGNGKQSVFPPSRHISGRQYRWDPLRSPDVLDEPLSVPEWILEYTENFTTVTSDEPDPVDWSKVISGGIDSGGRNEGLTRVLGRVLSPVPLDIDSLYQVASSLNKTMCNPPLHELELRTIVKSLFRRENISANSSEDERTVRRYMKQYGMNRSDAQSMVDSLT